MFEKLTNCKFLTNPGIDKFGDCSFDDKGGISQSTVYVVTKDYYLQSHNLLKFIYSEKATKFCEIFPLFLPVCTLFSQK